MFIIVLSQALDPVYQSALKLKNETSAALIEIQSLKVQQYIDTNVAPLLTRCRNYTTESISLSNNVVSASTQSQLSLKTAQSLATSIVNISVALSFIPSIDSQQLTPIYDNMLRVRQGFSALDLSNDLSIIRSGITAASLKILDYRSKITSLKSSLNAYKSLYDTVNSLTCIVPSQIP